MPIRYQNGGGGLSSDLAGARRPATWNGGPTGMAIDPGFSRAQPQQAQQAQPMQAGVQTSITPQGVFSPQYTQQAGNLASALAIGGRADALNPAMRQGVSVNSPMTQYGAGVNHAGGLAEAMMAGPQIAMQHGFQNAQNMLGGQVARDQEAQGWAGLGMDSWINQMQSNQAQQNNLLGFLSSLGRW